MPPKRPQPSLDSLPGVGPKVAEDLRSLGIHAPQQLKGKDPERLYERLRIRNGGTLDRCMRYTLRCAAYCASHPNASERKKRWWNWKD